MSRRTAVSMPSINQSKGFTPSNMRLIVLHIMSTVIAKNATRRVRLPWLIVHPQRWENVKMRPTGQRMGMNQSHHRKGVVRSEAGVYDDSRRRFYAYTSS